MQRLYYSFLLLLLCMNTNTFAQGVAEQESIWEREEATGNWGGLRAPFNNYGFTLELNLIGDVMGNVSGGINQKSVFIQNIDLKFVIDNEKLIGLPGSNILFSVLQNNGNSISQYTGDVQGVSNIEAEQAIRLFEVWIQQRLFADQLSVLGGLYDVNSEFDFIESASLFIQSSQGMGGDFAESGLIGPPTFPAAGLGGRIKFVPDRRIYIQAGLMDGAPASLNSAKSADFTWNNSGGTLATAELGLLSFGQESFKPQDNLSTRQSRSFIGREVSSDYRTKIALGVWSYSKNYVSDRYGTTLPSVTDNQNDKGIYILADWKWNPNPKKIYQQLSVFGRIGFTENEVSRFKSYGGGGITYKGLIPGDLNGLLGFSLASVQGSKLFQQINGQVDDFETVLELTYLTKVIPWLNIQPDIQYIISPGANLNTSNALVVGIRTDIAL
ncbi:carbohydrate porin [Rhodohalobacter sp. 8-1]|uniref:carbohydrate porin n=1 Tax=Rhodohalobacter sp. 8-1 TaxID=3131972 RepID=UPI0030EE2692